MISSIAAARAIIFAGLCSVVLLGETEAPQMQLTLQALAIGAAALLASRPWPRVGRVVRIAGPLLLGVTAVMGAEVAGMYRWLHFGPVSVDTGALLVPPLIAMLGRDPRPANAVAVQIAAVALMVQPAPVAAIALAVGVALSPAVRPRVATLAVCLLSVGVAIWRDVPLDPVPHVEQIGRLAYLAGPAWTLLIPACIGLMLYSARTPALRAVLAVFALAPLFGAWPVPFAGLGASIWVGVGLAIGLTAHPSPTRGNRTPHEPR